ncbi:hypothetical protein C8F04DRAFT_906180, partial [Mycena alexandri]
LSQQVTLTGLGSKLFDTGVSNLKDLHSLFARYFHGTEVTKASAAVGDDVAIVASNRYLTTLEDDPNAVGIAFGRGVDPMESFKPHVGASYVHAAENVVEYFKASTDTATGRVKFTHVEADPSSFRVGDVVEMQASVIAFRTQNKAVKLHYHLRALILISSAHSK